MIYYSIDWSGCTSNGHFGQGVKMFVNVVEAVDTFLEFAEREKDGYISFSTIDHYLKRMLMYHDPSGKLHVDRDPELAIQMMCNDVLNAHIRMGDRG